MGVGGDPQAEFLLRLEPEHDLSQNDQLDPQLTPAPQAFPVRPGAYQLCPSGPLWPGAAQPVEVAPAWTPSSRVSSAGARPESPSDSLPQESCVARLSGLVCGGSTLNAHQTL